MTFEKPKDDIDKKEQPIEKKEGNRLLFEFKRKVKSVDVSVGIEQGSDPIRGEVDLSERKINVRVTPEGVRRGIKAVSNFLNSPEGQEFMGHATDKVSAWRESVQGWRKERQRGKDSSTVSEYARQEGKAEADVIAELLNQIDPKK